MYPAKNCKGETDGYSNTDGKQLDHTYENGFCTVCDGFQSATGDGTESDPYQIGNAGQLYWFAAAVNDGHTDAWAVLTDDIIVNIDVLAEDGTLNGDGSGFLPWTPISETSRGKYIGTFDGKEYTVSGLYFNKSDTSYVGLFGYSSGTVKNVGVVDSYINGRECVGGIVGFNYGTITNCYNEGTVSGDFAGGVAGHNNKGTVESCYNAGLVSGFQRVGGLVGDNFGTIANCYTEGTVSGSYLVGGVTGYNSYSTVVNSYNIGSVSGESAVGGVVGENYEGTVANCYYDSTVYSGNAIGFDHETSTNVLGKTTEQFKSGEVAYLLQGEQTQQVWGQNIDGEGEKDAYPVFSDAKVYRAKNCKGEISGYSNTDGKQLDHTYENGFCTVCDKECEHSWNNVGQETTKPTCDTPGEMTYTCDYCGGTYNEAINAYHNNNLEYHAAKDAIDCQNPGNIEYWHCPGCDEVFADAYATEILNPWYIDITVDCVRPEDAADCAVVPCVICGNDTFDDGEHDVLQCKGGTCSKCGAEIEGYGCANYTTPACEDGICYYCGGFVAGFGHENGAWKDCIDGECAYGCGLKYPATQDHVDEDGDEYCDECWSHIDHVTPDVAAEINGTYYGSLADALAAAEDNNVDGITVDTIKLLKDVTWSGLLREVDLDLNGFVLSVDKYLVVFSDANILDNSASNSGLLLMEEAAKKYLVLPENNDQLPIYGSRMSAGDDKRVGYSFVEILQFNSAFREEEADFVFQPVLERSACDHLQNGAEISQVQVVVRVSWEGSDGQMRKQDFVYTDDLVRKFAASYNETKQGFKMMFTLKLNVENMADYGFQILVKSNTGVTIGTDLMHK